jgi:hypothetical protein
MAGNLVPGVAHALICASHRRNCAMTCDQGHAKLTTIMAHALKAEIKAEFDE